MMWLVFIDNRYVGTVIAADEKYALQRAAEKFGPTWSTIEVKLRASLG